MSKDNIQELIFQLEYKVLNNDNIKLFDYFFVKENKDECKMIYNGEKYKLNEYLKIDNNLNQGNSIKIQLVINNNITNISNMFNNCKALLSFRYISNINNFNNINEFDNYIDESNDLKEDEEKESFYDDSISISSIHNNSIVSKFSEINILINKLDTQPKKFLSNITDMSYIFYKCSSLISLPGVSRFDTKNVTNMNYLFYGCSSLISLPDISKWDTKNVTNMYYMFYGCSSLISLPDISKWNVNNVTNMNYRN